MTPWVTRSADATSIALVCVLQFGHGGDAVGDHGGNRDRGDARPCFNSATAVTPWVTGWSLYATLTPLGASIRPRR